MEKNRRTTITLLIALGCATLLTTLFFSRFTVDVISGESMFPTYKDAEIVLFYDEVIEKGDVIIFDYPYEEDVCFIKRVIATGGDTLHITDSKVFVNGEQIIEPYINEEEFVGEIKMVIPAGQCFVMGDNRNDSVDSRVFGCIAYEDVRGVVFPSKR